MPRIITASVKEEQTDTIISQLLELDGVLSVQVNRNTSVKDSGDVITITATNRIIPRVMDALEDSKDHKPSLSLYLNQRLYTANHHRVL